MSHGKGTEIKALFPGGGVKLAPAEKREAKTCFQPCPGLLLWGPGTLGAVWGTEKLSVQKRGGSGGTAWLLAGGSQHSRENWDPAVPASPRPYSRVSIPSPVMFRKEEASPLASPRCGPGVISGAEKRGRLHTVTAGRSPTACRGQWLVWERGMSLSLPAHGPRAAKDGLKEADPSHLKHSGAFLGAWVIQPCKCQPGMGDSKQLIAKQGRTGAKMEAKWDRLPGSCSGDTGTAWWHLRQALLLVCGWIEEWENTWMDGQMDTGTDGWAGGRTRSWINGWMDGDVAMGRAGGAKSCHCSIGVASCRAVSSSGALCLGNSKQNVTGSHQPEQACTLQG